MLDRTHLRLCGVSLGLTCKRGCMWGDVPHRHHLLLCGLGLGWMPGKSCSLPLWQQRRCGSLQALLMSAAGLRWRPVVRGSRKGKGEIMQDPACLQNLCLGCLMRQGPGCLMGHGQAAAPNRACGTQYLPMRGVHTIHST